MSLALRVFDPPQCCATGVCGPDVDPAVVQFAADLRWLTAQGVEVERYNLAQQPEAFLQEPVVRDAVNASGTGVLPLLVAAGLIVAHSRYPSRSDLARIAGLDVPSSDPEPDPEAEGHLLALDIADQPCCDPGDGCC